MLWAFLLYITENKLSIVCAGKNKSVTKKLRALNYIMRRSRQKHKAKVICRHHSWKNKKRRSG